MACLVIGLGAYAILALTFDAFKFLEAKGRVLRHRYLMNTALEAVIILAIMLGAVLLESDHVFVFLFSLGVLIGSLLGAAALSGVCVAKWLIRRSTSP